MLISQLAKQSGLTTHTIRFYEKMGLIKGKRKEGVSSNNYYHYDDSVLEKLLLISDAKSIGFTLQEIKSLLDAWYNKRFGVEKKMAILDEKLKNIDEKIKQLKEMKKLLHEFKKQVHNGTC